MPSNSSRFVHSQGLVRFLTGNTWGSKGSRNFPFFVCEAAGIRHGLLDMALALAYLSATFSKMSNGFYTKSR